MSLISVSKLNKSYGVKPVLEDVSFHVNKGDRIGVVGANGAGKSTLIRILAGDLQPDSGDIFRERDLSFGYLRQRDHFPSGGTVREEMERIFSWQQKAEKRLAELTEEMSRASGPEAASLIEEYDSLSREFAERRGYSYRSEIKGILNSLAFTDDYLDKPVDILSGGERTRLALAAMLLEAPDLLFLDEPTNHLDIGTLKWLEQYLRSYKGTLVIISHDRYFLDRTVNRIFGIEGCKLTVYEGNYSWYAEQKRRIYEEQLRHYEHVQEEIRRQEDMIRTMKGHGTEHLVKRAQSREKRLAMIDRPDRPVEYDARIRLKFEEDLQSGTDVLQAQGLSKSFGEGADRRLLFENVDLDIKRGDRICLVGPNGIGKTTLLKMILGELPADSGTLRLGQNVMPGYYDQEQRLLDPEKTVLDEVHSTYIRYDQTELRSLLGRFLFRGDDVFKKVKDLAGGEKARLSLLKLMMSGANLLLMDEPTNHLDIQAKEVFEDALLEFPGTLIIVSHDRYLLKKIPTAIYELGPDGIEIYLGDYDYYEEKSSSAGSGRAYLSRMGKERMTQAEAAEGAAAKLSKQERIAKMQEDKAKAAAKRKAEKQLAQAEEAVTEAESKVASIEEQLCRPEVFADPSKSAGLSAELAQAKDELERLYEAWMTLQESAEAEL